MIDRTIDHLIAGDEAITITHENDVLPGLLRAFELVVGRKLDNEKTDTCSAFAMIDEITEDNYILSLLKAEMDKARRG